MKYALAIGYPLRLRIGEERMVQEIELQERWITLSLEQAMQWGKLCVWRELSETEKPAVEELMALGTVVSGDSVAEVLSALGRCVPLRQGFCLPAEEGTAVQMGREQILLTGLQERVWLAANGKNTLEEILEQLEFHWRDIRPELQELLLENLLGLTSMELCYFR